MTRLALFIGLSISAVGVAAVAQQQETPKPPQNQNTAAQATVDKIMDQAVGNISKRYNLNDQQREQTDVLMKREVRRFLLEHEKDVWPVIRDLLAAQLGGSPPESKDDMVRIGKAARPLAKLAEKAIFDANQEWRSILNDEQKRVHDFDLADMRAQFTEIDKKFEEWERGEAKSGPILPTGPATVAKQPPRPKMPPPGLPKPEPWKPDPSVFDLIVEKFIKDYELDQSQIESARSIAEEAKARSAAFAESNKQQMADIHARQTAAMDAKNQAEIAAAEADRNKLLEPYHDLVSQVEDRLKGLLTTAQIERHAQRVAAGELSKNAASKAPAGARRVNQTSKPGELAGPPAPGGAPQAVQPAKSQPQAGPKDGD